MKHGIWVLLAAAGLASPTLAQEDDEQAPPTEPAEETPEDEELNESGLDVQGFDEDDDDDFVPTEDISADQSIPFPTDI